MVADDVRGSTEGNPFSFQDVVDVIVAKGWGAVYAVSASGTQFEFEFRIIIGNAATTTWFVDVSKHVEFLPSAVSGNYQRLIELKKYAYLRLGNVVDATNHETDKGCAVIFDNEDNRAYIVIIYGADDYVYSSVELYDSKLSCIPLLDKNIVYAASIAYSRNITIFNCIFDGVYLTACRQTNIYNLYVSNVPYGMAYLRYIDAYPSTIQKVTIDYVGYGLYQNAYYAHDFTDLRIQDVDFQTFRMINVVVDCSVIDAEIPAWTFSWEGTNTAKLYRKYSFDLTVTNKLGVAISGVTVTLKDKDGNVVFTDTTDALGQIATKTVSRGYYDQAHGDTLQDYSPHTIIVSKTGYITISTIFTFDKYLDWRIPLLMQTDVAGAGAAGYTRTVYIEKKPTVTDYLIYSLTAHILSERRKTIRNLKTKLIIPLEETTP